VTYPCLTALDASGQKLAYTYFEDEPSRQSAAKLQRLRRGAADRSEKSQSHLN